MAIMQAKRTLMALTLCALCWASGGGALPALPDSPFVVGHLTCTVLNESQAPASGPAQGHDVLCHFRPGISGPEETYVGTLQGAGRAKDLLDQKTLILVVKRLGSNEATPGMLAQSYSADAATRAGRSAPLVGDKNNTLVLQPMIERKAGESAKKGEAADLLILQVELQLRSSPA